MPLCEPLIDLKATLTTGKQLESPLRPGARAAEDLQDLGRAEQLAFAIDQVCRALDLLLAVRCERDVGAAGILPRLGPFRFAVADKEHPWCRSVFVRHFGSERLSLVSGCVTTGSRT